MIFDLATAIHGTRAEVVHLGPGAVAVTGRLLDSDLATLLGSVAVDSRTVTRESLFVALAGEHVDGHAYVADAFRHGARACMVTSTYDRSALEAAMTTMGQDRPANRKYLLLVEDPLTALQALASHWRSLSRASIIGITGSIGKTTTKEIMASLLGTVRNVLKSEANLNTEIGLPLTVLRLRDEHQIAILEMGMYAVGEIATLTRIASPGIGVVTGVAPIHLERLGSIERIARAKSELVAGLPARGLAVVNGDDSWTRAMAKFSGSCRAVKVGFAEDCEYRASDVRADGLRGISFTVHAEGRQEQLQLPLPGVHLVHAALAAIVVAREVGLDWQTIVAGMAAVRVEGRQQIIHGPGGVVILDDSYNAAPQSVLAALEVLRESPGEHIAVLGDMLELGPDEEAAHRLVGERAAAVTDGLVVTGDRAAWIADAAEAAGMRPDRIVRTMNNHDAAQAAQALIPVSGATRGSPTRIVSTVLVKGSRGMAMEEIVRDMASQ